MFRMLIDRLRALWRSRRSEVNSQWNRTLPFGDYIVDRWEKAKALGWGEDASCYDNVLVIGDVKVGARTWVGKDTTLDGSGGLQIGSNCSIGERVGIYTHDSSRWAVTNGEAEYDRAPTKIGNCCFIGPSSMVLMGITIGDRAIIRGMTFVNRDVPAGALAYGNPMKIIPDGVRKLGLTSEPRLRAVG